MERQEIEKRDFMFVTGTDIRKKREEKNTKQVCR